MNQANTLGIEAALACERCGGKGQLRHAPPPAPMSGIWCARCYTRLVARSRLLHAIYRWRVALIVAVVAVVTWAQHAQAQPQAAAKSLRLAVGDRVEYTVGGQQERGTVTGFYKRDASGAAESFYVVNDRTGLPNQYVIVWLNQPRKLDAAAANVHTAPPMRARAPCPSRTARQGARASAELARALIQCHLEDNSGSYAGYTVNADITEFRPGQTVRGIDMGNALVRYADPNGWVTNVFVRFDTRIYGSSGVTVFTGAEGPYMVYVDYNNRWTVGNGYIKRGEQTRLALPR
ncbi:MAG: hypothetical protein JNL19_16620 [Burkholderiales bacterium]|nr:hypothetical protein [Burkholderiales bacterium]